MVHASRRSQPTRIDWRGAVCAGEGFGPFCCAEGAAAPDLANPHPLRTCCARARRVPRICFRSRRARPHPRRPRLANRCGLADFDDWRAPSLCRITASRALRRSLLPSRVEWRVGSPSSASVDGWRGSGDWLRSVRGCVGERAATESKFWGPDPLARSACGAGQNLRGRARQPLARSVRGRSLHTHAQTSANHRFRAIHPLMHSKVNPLATLLVTGGGFGARRVTP